MKRWPKSRAVSFPDVQWVKNLFYVMNDALSLNDYALYCNLNSEETASVEKATNRLTVFFRKYDYI